MIECLKDKNILIGVNYWPRYSAMYMWKNFNINLIIQDLSLIKNLKMNCLRIFLIWEDFQDSPNKINPESFLMLEKLLLECKKMNLKVILSIFQGHMSGINFLPEFTLNKSVINKQLFPIFCNGKVGYWEVKDIYSDPLIIKAQKLLIKELVGNFKNLVYSWDIANEIDNVLIPSSTNKFNNWVSFISSEIKEIDKNALVTLGTHSQNLEKNVNVNLKDLSRYLDYISMHGYPIYSSLATHHLDDNYVPFLYFASKIFTKKEVYFTEFGLPSMKKSKFIKTPTSKVYIPNEDQVYKYLNKVLEKLYILGCRCFLYWCFADYDKSLYCLPPFNLFKHERYFGLVDKNGNYKKFAKIFLDFTNQFDNLNIKMKQLKNKLQNFYLNFKLRSKNLDKFIKSLQKRFYYFMSK